MLSSMTIELGPGYGLRRRQKVKDNLWQSTGNSDPSTQRRSNSEYHPETDVANGKLLFRCRERDHANVSNLSMCQYACCSRSKDRDCACGLHRGRHHRSHLCSRRQSATPDNTGTTRHCNRAANERISAAARGLSRQLCVSTLVLSNERRLDKCTHQARDTRRSSDMTGSRQVPDTHSILALRRPLRHASTSLGH